MSEIYDATFNAIRSNTSFGNIDEAIKQAIGEAGISHAIEIVKNDILNIVYEYGRPSSIYKPRLFREGNMWGCIHGKDPMNGVEGYGESPALAYEDFDKQWVEKLKTK